MEKRLMIVVVLLSVPLLMGWHWFEPVAKMNQNGIDAYRAQKYQEALNQFLSARGERPDSAQLKNNTASALYQMKKYKEALEEFSRIDPENPAPAAFRTVKTGFTVCFLIFLVSFVDTWPRKA